MPKNYLQYRKNYHSQTGEDGIIEQLFKELNITTGTMVDFGAWDGKYLSNLYHHFTANPNLHMVLIEGDTSKFVILERDFAEHATVCCINAYVSEDSNSANCLTNLLDGKITDELQLLSIDVDGLDFAIWKAFDKARFRPKIVIIEFDKWKDAEARKDFFATFRADGYTLLCVTGNYIFVRNDLGYEQVDEELLFQQSGHMEIALHLGQIPASRFDEIWASLLNKKMSETKMWVDL